MLQGISIWQLLILLAIVLLVFGTKRLRNLGGDLGTAIRGFRKGLGDDEDAADDKQPEQLDDSTEATSKTRTESKTHSSS